MFRSPVALALLLFAAPVAAQVSAPAQPSSLGGQPQAPTAEDCKVIDLAADSMECAGGLCTLDGAVELRCLTTRLNADHVDILYDENQQFAGARASGNVLYIRGSHVMTCNNMTVGADHIQGRVDEAMFRVKQFPPDLKKPGIPAGRNVATFSGDIVRDTEQDYKVYHGDFTLCDCGLVPPSWRFTAREIDAHLGRRATLWWPVFRLRPFSLFELPIPMAPISMPLSRRAFGIMPLNPRFLGGRPMLDLPIFIPLGDHYDLTVIPGTRMDWAPPLKFNPSTWGAPRLGSRFRYAPADKWFGEVAVDYTHDGEHWRSKIADTKDGKDVADINGSRLLSERVAINGLQRAQVADNLDWSATLSWVSDDLMLSDFATSLRDAASNYLPTRTEVLYRPDGMSALVSADYFVLTNNFAQNNSVLPTSVDQYEYSNTKGRERETMHRMPFVRLAMEPLPLGHGVAIDADASFVRYGRLSSIAQTDLAPLTDPLTVGNAIGAISYGDRLGNFNVFARASSDTLLTDYRESSAGITSLILNARVDTRLSRRFGSLLHTITPRIEYKSIAAQSGELPSTRSIDPATRTTTQTSVSVIYDPRLQRNVFHQAQLAIDQALWTRGPLSALPALGLNIRQPFDVENGKVLQTQVELLWRTPAWLTGSVRTSLAPGQAKALRELSATSTLALRYFTLGLGYARWQLNADRFVRSIYELAAPYEEDDGTVLRPIHTLSVNTSLNIKQRVSLSYSTDYLLPIPRETWPVPDDPSNPANRRTFTEHRGSIGYRSPCNCWGISAGLAFPDSELWWDNKRINILFDIGGYTLGN